MNKFVIMGANGSGKGTQAAGLSKTYDLIHISVGKAHRPFRNGRPFANPNLVKYGLNPVLDRLGKVCANITCARRCIPHIHHREAGTVTLS
jgi:hypothetical protein